MIRCWVMLSAIFVRSGKCLPVILLASAICSCRSVPLESRTVTDTVYINKFQHDSIYRHDSIYIRERGDTVFVEKYRYLFVDKLRHDTLYISHADSIRVPYPVEKKLTRWQQIKLELGGWAFGIVMAFLLIILGWMMYRRRKK